jgi:hypothetical protein
MNNEAMAAIVDRDYDSVKKQFVYGDGGGGPSHYELYSRDDALRWMERHGKQGATITSERLDMDRRKKITKKYTCDGNGNWSSAQVSTIDF